MRLFVALGAVAAVGCAAPPPVPPAPPAPKPLPPPAVTVSAAPTASAAPAPPIDPRADPVKLAVARSVCPASIKHKDGNVLVGCRVCPFDVDRAKLDGSVDVDPEEFWPMQALFQGSFSKPGAREAAATVVGCAQHGLDVMVLAEQTSAGWRATAPLLGESVERCEIYRRKDGRDLLVCQTGVTWFATHSTYVTAYDFARATADDPGKARSNLVRVDENGHAVCWALSQSDGVLQGRVLGFRFEDVNHDGQEDVVVDVSHRATPYSPRIERVIQKACADAEARVPKEEGDLPPVPQPIDVAPLLGEPAKETLQFLYDGQEFRPTAKTAARLERLAPLL